MLGIGAAPQSRVLTLAHSFIIQMPSQVREFLPCRKAIAWASLATFLGLLPWLDVVHQPGQGLARRRRS